MTTDTSRLGLGALVVRTWQIRLARIVTKLARGCTNGSLIFLINS